MYRRAEKGRLNSSVLIDRTGTVVGVYDKVNPYWTEFDLKPPALPGQHDVPVYETDFGKVGFAICYDAKFPEVFERLRGQGCRAGRLAQRLPGLHGARRPSRCCTTTRS